MQISAKASTDNALRDLYNSPNDIKAEFNNCVTTCFNKTYFENKLKHAYFERCKVPSSNCLFLRKFTGYYVFTKSVNSMQFSRVLIGSRNSGYPWLFTVLRQEPRWRLVSRHFRKMKFER